MAPLVVPQDGSSKGHVDDAADRLVQLSLELFQLQEEIAKCRQISGNLEIKRGAADLARVRKVALEKQLGEVDQAIHKLDTLNSFETFFCYSAFCGSPSKQDRRDQLDKDKQITEANLNACQQQIVTLKQEVQEREQAATRLQAAEHRFNAALQKKKAILMNHETNVTMLERIDPANGTCIQSQLEASRQHQANLEQQEALLTTAITAGTRAIRSLKGVASHLDSAANWGTADMLGGGMLVTMAKRSAMDRAQSAAAAAKRDVSDFNESLVVLHQTLETNLEAMNSGGWAFADYMFDNLFVDWHVQSQINKARSSCSASIAKANTILREAQSALNKTKRNVTGCKEDQVAMVLSFGSKTLRDS